MEKGNREVNRWTVDLKNVEKGDTVLEVGSGNGAAIEYICRETEAGYTPDEVENMVAVAGFHSVARRQNGLFWCLEGQK